MRHSCFCFVFNVEETTVAHQVIRAYLQRMQADVSNTVYQTQNGPGNSEILMELSHQTAHQCKEDPKLSVTPAGSPSAWPEHSLVTQILNAWWHLIVGRLWKAPWFLKAELHSLSCFKCLTSKHIFAKKQKPHSRWWVFLMVGITL